MKQRKPLYISIGLGLMALLLAVSYLRKREQELLDLSHPVPVLVATRDILKNSPIEEDMLEMVEVPKQFLQPDALRQPADAVGRLTQSPIRKGEQLVGTKLITYGSDTGLAVKIPAGMRAISISVDEISGVSGLIKPDNYVDLLSTFNFGDQDKNNHETFTLFQDVRVLAVSHDLGVGLARSDKGKKTDEVAPRGSTSTVTLALDPQQVQDLILAEQAGELHLSLRSLSETEKTFNLTPSTITSLTGVKEKTARQQAYRQYREK